jgi:protein involved in polysaccharide export with SLBB domain
MAWFRLILVAACAALLAPPADAQRSNWDPQRAQVSRESLQVLMTRLEETARSPVYSNRLRERSLAEAALLRQRLAEGDFFIGDRIAFTIEGGPAPLSDTATVDVNRSIAISQFGSISLAGVLRSELTAHLTREVGRFITNPVVRALALIRLTIVGEVRMPGFYTLPVDMLVDQALTAAGGPTGLARLDQIRIERGGETIWDGATMEQALAEGRTLNALGVRAGDRVVVPRGTQRSWESTARTIGLLASLPFTIIAIVNLFN